MQYGKLKILQEYLHEAASELAVTAKEREFRVIIESSLKSPSQCAAAVKKRR